MAESVLELVLSARYLGGAAFSQMAGDVEALKTQTNALKTLASGFGLVGDIMIGAGLAVGAAATAAVIGSQKWQQALLDIKAATVASSDQIKQLAADFQSSAEKVGLSSTDIGNGMYFIMSGAQAMGVGVADILNSKLIPAFADYIKVAKAGDASTSDVASAAQDLTHIFGAFHDPVSQWADDLGTLSILEKDSSLTQQQLTAAMLRAAPVADQLGLSFRDVAITTAAMATSGLAGARAGTELASGLRMLTTSAKAQKELGTLGIDPKSLYDAKGNLLDVSNILDMLVPKLAGMSKPDQLKTMTNLFGAVGEKSLGLLTQGGVLDTFKRLEGAVPTTPGDAFNQLQTRATESTKPIDQLKTATKNLFDTIGTGVSNALNPFIIGLTKLVDKINEFLSKHPAVLGEVSKMLLTAPAALIGGGIGMKVLGGGLGFLGGPSGEKGGTRGGKLAGGIGDTLGNLFGMGSAAGTGVKGGVVDAAKWVSEPTKGTGPGGMMKDIGSGLGNIG